MCKYGQEEADESPLLFLTVMCSRGPDLPFGSHQGETGAKKRTKRQKGGVGGEGTTFTEKEKEIILHENWLHDTHARILSVK